MIPQASPIFQFVEGFDEMDDIIVATHVLRAQSLN